jgi:hypothetical protein
MSEKRGSGSLVWDSQAMKEGEMAEKEEMPKRISRKEFVKGAALGAGALAGVGALASCGPAATPVPTAAPGETAAPAPTCPPAAECTPCPAPGIPEQWDQEADVVVVGSGLAGLSTAITAYDAGASVLVLEKLDQEHEGGNSIVSGNLWCAPDDVSQGVEYIKAAAFGRVEDESVFTLISQGLKDNLTAIEELGGEFGLFNYPPAWPGLPGASTIKMYAMLVDGVPTSGTGALWQLYRDNVAEREIDVLYESPAKQLIQHPESKEILGVKVQMGGGDRYIKAKKAVVLACGGFEFSKYLINQYLPAYPILGWGTPGNTGDGINMAQAVGAGMWHMQQQNWGTPNMMSVPEYDIPIRVRSMPANAYLWVDKQGNRYVNEATGMGSYGFPGWEVTLWFDAAATDFLRIPTWVVLDDTTRKAGPFVAGGSGWFNRFANYNWSEDNSVEVEKGWILTADTIAELGAAIAVDPDNQGPTGEALMTPAALEATVAKYNEYCAAQNDADFGRPAETLVPVETTPFYAVKLWPGMNNTEGGPARNTNCQVLDPSGEVIPRLYGTGELGSFWGLLYNGGGNLGECMFTGRIAGEHAVALDAWD